MMEKGWITSAYAKRMFSANWLLIDLLVGYISILLLSAKLCLLMKLKHHAPG